MVRYFSGRAISQGGRDHMSHRLVAVGLSESIAVLVLWSISVVGGLDALVLYKIGFSYAWFITALLLLAFVLFGIVLARVRVYDELDVLRNGEGAAKAGFCPVLGVSLQAAGAVGARGRCDGRAVVVRRVPPPVRRRAGLGEPDRTLRTRGANRRGVGV